MKLTKREWIIYSVIAAVFIAILTTFFIIVFHYYPYEFAYGDGSLGNPFIIESQQDLIGFRENVNHGNSYEGQYIKLNNDIYLEEENWVPIGSMKKPFKGCFDGNSKQIFNIVMNDLTGNNGFFVAIENKTDDFAVKNLKLEINNTKLNEDFDCFGGLAASIKGNLLNVEVVASVDVGGDFSSIGVISAVMEGNALNCTGKGVLIFKKLNEKESYISCGIARLTGNLTNCTADGYIYQKLESVDVGLSNSITGGLVAEVSANSLLKDCLVNLMIESSSTTGGLVGKCLGNLEVDGCLVRGEIECRAKKAVCIGGILPSSESEIVIKNTSSYPVIILNMEDELNVNTSYIGGIIAKGKGEITSSVFRNLITVSATNSFIVGGIAGQFNGSLENCYTSKEYYLISRNSYVIAGGLVGIFENGNIKNCFSNSIVKYRSGNSIVDNISGNVAGYLIGKVEGDSYNIENNYYVKDIYPGDDGNTIYAKTVFNYEAGDSLEAESLKNYSVANEELKSGSPLNGFGEYVSPSDLEINSGNVWMFEIDKEPILYFEYVEETEIEEE